MGHVGADVLVLRGGTERGHVLVLRGVTCGQDLNTTVMDSDEVLNTGVRPFVLRGTNAWCCAGGVVPRELVLAYCAMEL